MVGSSFYSAVLELCPERESARGFWVSPGLWSVVGKAEEAAGVRNQVTL